ncbi:hypothetical protein WISP_03370 [Willisornis vidua]|uniref:Uncharacterized protein n=1 Tax=Willisornis vidua TaxID=1566151 RepID=A0ABQ9DY31_9PASS|nr:hypothetical protein WISP_03370 [Willisornis vidua]
MSGNFEWGWLQGEHRGTLLCVKKDISVFPYYVHPWSLACEKPGQGDGAGNKKKAIHDMLLLGRNALGPPEEGSEEESEEVYQRQVLSIACIVFGIVVVGMLCAAFYFKAKKQTKQIHEQLKETQNRKTYSLNASSMMAKPECMAQSQVQLQNYSKPDRHPAPILHKVMESSFSGPQSFPEALSPDRGPQPIKQHRYKPVCVEIIAVPNEELLRIRMCTLDRRLCALI